MHNRLVMHFRPLFVVLVQLHLHLAFTSFRERCANVYLLPYSSFALKNLSLWASSVFYDKRKLLGNTFHSLGAATRKDLSP